MHVECSAKSKFHSKCNMYQRIQSMYTFLKWKTHSNVNYSSLPRTKKEESFESSYLFLLIRRYFLYVYEVHQWPRLSWVDWSTLYRISNSNTLRWGISHIKLLMGPLVFIFGFFSPSESKAGLTNCFRSFWSYETNFFHVHIDDFVRMKYRLCN